MDPAILGPIDSIFFPIIEPLLIIAAITNLITRHLAYRSLITQSEANKKQDSNDEKKNELAPLKRYRVHEMSNVFLILFAFYYMTIHHHGGMVLSLMVLTTVLADIFEFEARMVEYRNGMKIEFPKGAILGSILVTVYIIYLVFVPSGPLDQFIMIMP